MSCGYSYTVKSWWNLQRMKLFRRTTSYLFGFIDTVTKQLGLTNSQTNTITDNAVTVTQDVHKRYQQEVIEFGSSNSFIFTMIATFALVHLFCFNGGIMKMNSNLTLQIMQSSIMITVNIPVRGTLHMQRQRLPVILSHAQVYYMASLAFCLSILF